MGERLGPTPRPRASQSRKNTGKGREERTTGVVLKTGWWMGTKTKGRSSHPLRWNHFILITFYFPKYLWLSTDDHLSANNLRKYVCLTVERQSTTQHSNTAGISLLTWRKVAQLGAARTSVHRAESQCDISGALWSCPYFKKAASQRTLSFTYKALHVYFRKTGNTRMCHNSFNYSSLLNESWDFIPPWTAVSREQLDTPEKAAVPPHTQLEWLQKVLRFCLSGGQCYVS